MSAPRDTLNELIANGELDVPLEEVFEPTDEQEAAFRESFGYTLDDPKHPTYHERYADVWDMRDGK